MEIEYKNIMKVFSPAITRKLIKYYNFRIVDIQPSRYNSEATVFMFDKNEVVDGNKMEDVWQKLYDESKHKVKDN